MISYEMNFKLFDQIISSWKEFEVENEGKGLGLKEFNDWLSIKTHSYSPTEIDHVSEGDINVDISRRLVYLYRYAKMHIKNGMEDYPELSNEDFTYLYALVRTENLTKTELIEKNIHEKPTGQDVIRRLINADIIGEKIDETDRRNKRLFITEKGRKLFEETLNRTRSIAKVITGNLSLAEKRQLLYLIDKLDHFHNPIYLAKRDTKIDELISEYSLN